MNLNEFIKELQDLQQQGCGLLQVAVLIDSQPGYAPGVRGALVEDVSEGDIGGWGNNTIYIKTYERLISSEEE